MIANHHRQHLAGGHGEEAADIAAATAWFASTVGVPTTGAPQVHPDGLDKVGHREGLIQAREFKNTLLKYSRWVRYCLPPVPWWSQRLSLWNQTMSRFEIDTKHAWVGK
jgi:hypothetical protein